MSTVVTVETGPTSSEEPGDQARQNSISETTPPISEEVEEIAETVDEQAEDIEAITEEIEQVHEWQAKIETATAETQLVVTSLSQVVQSMAETLTALVQQLTPPQKSGENPEDTSPTAIVSDATQNAEIQPEVEAIAETAPEQETKEQVARKSVWL